MKKTLLLICFLTVINLQAQDFWTELSTAQPATSTGIRSISIVNNSVTWLNMSCGSTGCSTIRRYASTTNGGNTWTTGIVDLGPQSTNLEIANIAGVSSQVAYAAAFPKTNALFGGVWKTEDGGTTWIKQPTATFTDPNYSFPNLVHFWNVNEGVVMGDPVTDGYFEVYTTVDGGVNWSRVTSASALLRIDVNEYGLMNNFTVVGNSIWALTTFGRILRSTDKGLTWAVSQSPIPDFGCGIATCGIQASMAFTDENKGLILDENGYLLYGTSDGGTTWETVEWSGALRSFSVAAVPGLANTYITVGEDVISSPERGSSYTIDGGLTWIDINNNPDQNYVDGGVIQMLNEDYGFASGFTESPTEGGIFRWGGGQMLRTAILANETFAINNVKVAPNPTSGLLNIKGKNIKQVSVFDLLGKEISITIYDGSDTVACDLGALNNGLYLVKVTNDKGTSLVKVVKQ